MSNKAVGQLPWGHITVLIDKLDDAALREWYASQAVDNGWSRNVLLNQIMSKLHQRLGAAPSNFARTLPAGESELVQQMTKDPYNLEFLGLGAGVAERKLESALVAHLQRFLLELGAGFAFVGRQYRFEVGGDEFFADLLFYHLHLRRFLCTRRRGRRRRSATHAGVLPHPRRRSGADLGCGLSCRRPMAARLSAGVDGPRTSPQPTAMVTAWSRYGLCRSVPMS